MYQIALDVLGAEGLDAWLREQRYPQLNLLFKNDVWLRVDAGPIVERLCQLRATAGMYFESVMPSGTDLQNFRQCRALLFTALLQALPIEQLPADWLELRLSVDLGL